MGWKERSKKRPYGRRDKNNKERNSDRKGVRGTWEDKGIVKENAAFETFYKAQEVVPEGEWDAFMTALRDELPHSFRLIGCRGEAKSKVLLQLLQERYFSKLEGAGEVDGYKIGPPEALPWYPDGLGFQLNLPKKVVRKQMALHDLHTFLIAETELGNVSRQETVSMIPPLLLDVRPEHKVLDMCAAPGSKTAQLVEALHEGTLEPTGFVIANDSDNKRCYLLVHQSLKRLNNACCVVVNHDASTLPNIYRSVNSNGVREGLIRYDRILADVPCTGDGTTRKNIDMWRKWNIHDPISLHPLQLRIAKRGAELLEVGGRMVYSTCSLNPIEDEAVLTQLILWSKGALELVNVSTELPALKRVPGRSTWKIMDKAGNFYEKVEDVVEDKRGKLVPSLFPPTPEQAEQLHLDRAFRILPHHQNTGGFFVAVLRKTKELTEKPSVDDAPSETVEEKKGDESPVPKKKKPWLGHREANFHFLTEDDPQWLDVKSNYHLSKEFPATQLLHRSQEGVQKRNLYMVNAAVKAIIQTNFDYIKIINSGLRMFGRVEQKYELCRFRLAQDGLETLFPYLGARIFELPPADLGAVVGAGNGNSVRMDALTVDTHTKLESVSEGSVCIHTTVQGNRLILCAWRGKKTVSAYVESHVKLHILRLLGQDTSLIEAEMLSSRKKKPKDEAASTTDSIPEKEGKDEKEEDKDNAETAEADKQGEEDADSKNGESVPEEDKAMPKS